MTVPLGALGRGDTRTAGGAPWSHPPDKMSVNNFLIYTDYKLYPRDILSYVLFGHVIYYSYLCYGALYFLPLSHCHVYYFPVLLAMSAGMIIFV